METNVLVFQFADRKEAYSAFDTLMELGYRPVFHIDKEQPTLHIHVQKNDITSALEISQAHGGMLLEQPDGAQLSAYDAAYELGEELSIPAHIVTEDLSEEYLEGRDRSALASVSFPEEDESEQWDALAEKSLNYFSADRI